MAGQRFGARAGEHQELASFDMPSWFPPALAQTVVFVPLRIAFLIILALIVRFILHRLITRAVRRAIGQQPQFKLKAAQVLVDATTLPAERRQQRILALGSLAGSTVTFVIFFVAILMILAELGFNITTIIAGTSVVAVTVAFGVQSIVKDLISGIFMLVEDQLGVGDYIDMEKASGTVEEVGLRITQLRDDDGNVWYVRNGEVVRVGNFSQGGTERPSPETQPAS
jgi:small-conductance mechanosensitive channel